MVTHLHFGVTAHRSIIYIRRVMNQLDKLAAQIKQHELDEIETKKVIDEVRKEFNENKALYYNLNLETQIFFDDKELKLISLEKAFKIQQEKLVEIKNEYMRQRIFANLFTQQ